MRDARESAFWAKVVRPGLSPFGKILRVENALATGFPDCVYTLGLNQRQRDGFLELKALPGWPVQAGTAVQIPHYTPEQREWHRAWREARGRVFVAVVVEGSSVRYTDDLTPVGRRTPDEFFLFDAREAADHIGRWTRGHWLMYAKWHGTKFVGRAVASVLIA